MGLLEFQEHEEPRTQCPHQRPWTQAYRNQENEWWILPWQWWHFSAQKQTEHICTYNFSLLGLPEI